MEEAKSKAGETAEILYRYAQEIPPFPCPHSDGKGTRHESEEVWQNCKLPIRALEVAIKRFGRTRPEEIKSIEQLVKTQEKKKAERRAHKQLKKLDALTNKKTLYNQLII